MTQLGFLFYYLLASMSTIQMHDLHLSKALVNYNGEVSAMEVSLQIFIDDLELAMAAADFKDLRIATTKEDPEADDKIASFLEDNFEVRVDGKPVQFAFLGKEPSDDLMAIWCYLEATEVLRPATVEISYRILLDQFDDQKNVVTFMAGPKREFFLFDSKEFSGTVNL